MSDPADPGLAAARTADIAAIPLLIASPRADILHALIENPALDEMHLLLLLKRGDLPGSLLEEILKKKPWRGNYRVRLAVTAHPHAPRLTAMRMLREIHLMDLMRISILPAVPNEIRRLAEERILAQLPQVPLAHRLMLARRGSGNVAAGVVKVGPIPASKAALDNGFLSEAHLLKILSKADIASVTIAAIAEHKKWSNVMNIRVALVRHPHTPLETVLAFLPKVPRRSIQDLLELVRLPGNLREVLRQEMIRRERR